MNRHNFCPIECTYFVPSWKTETVAQRLEAYHAQTAPLIAYYERTGALSRIDAMGAIEEIASNLSYVVTKVTA